VDEAEDGEADGDFDEADAQDVEYLANYAPVQGLRDEGGGKAVDVAA